GFFGFALARCGLFRTSPRCRRLRRTPGTFAPNRLAELQLTDFKVDLAFVEVDPHDLNFNAIAQTEVAPTALAGQTMLDRIEVVVITRQRRNVNQAFDVNVLELDKQAKAGHRRDHAREGFTDAILHEL